MEVAIEVIDVVCLAVIVTAQALLDGHIAVAQITGCGINVADKQIQHIRSNHFLAFDDQFFCFSNLFLSFFHAFGFDFLFRGIDCIEDIGDEVLLLIGEVLHGRLFVGFQVCFQTLDIVNDEVILISDESLRIALLGLVDVSSEGSELLHVHSVVGSVHIHDPFVDVAGHVVQAVVIGGVFIDGGCGGCTVVQRASYPHVIAASACEIGVHTAVLTRAGVVIPGVVTVPRVGPAIRNQFSIAVPNQSQSSELPFCLSGQAVRRLEQAVREANISRAGRTGSEIGQTFRNSLGGVLSREVCFCRKELLVQLRFGAVGDETLPNKQLLIDTVSSPLAEIIRLVPRNTHHWIVLVSRVTQVVIDVRFIVSQLLTPHQGVGQRALHHLAVRIAVDAVQPVEVFQPERIRDLGFIHVE